MNDLIVFYTQIISLYYVITFSPAAIERVISVVKKGDDYSFVFRDYVVLISLAILLILDVPEFLL